MPVHSWPQELLCNLLESCRDRNCRGGPYLFFTFLYLGFITVCDTCTSTNNKFAVITFLFI